ncbi:MAG: ankyrin repeat domain-containing protein [Candidatus Wallbacteria bacterium]|nr:ankyrin repeat domain-containing protein [Candidatus Wallbacteria bacterium]
MTGLKISVIFYLCFFRGLAAGATGETTVAVRTTLEAVGTVETRVRTAEVAARLFLPEGFLEKQAEVRNQTSGGDIRIVEQRLEVLRNRMYLRHWQGLERVYRVMNEQPMRAWAAEVNRIGLKQLLRDTAKVHALLFGLTVDVYKSSLSNALDSVKGALTMAAEPVVQELMTEMDAGRTASAEVLLKKGIAALGDPCLAGLVLSQTCSTLNPDMWELVRPFLKLPLTELFARSLEAAAYHGNALLCAYFLNSRDCRSIKFIHTKFPYLWLLIRENHQDLLRQMADCGSVEVTCEIAGVITDPDLARKLSLHRLGSIVFQHAANADIAGYLIESGVPVNEGFASGSALANVEDPDVARVLIDHGAVLCWESDGSSPDYGRQVFKSWDETPVRSVRNRKVLEVLFQNGLDLNKKDQYGKTPLHCWNLSADAVEFLIEKGLSVNECDNSGRTPLFYSCSNMEVVKLLLEHGADPKVRSENNATLLHAWSASDAFVSLMIEKGVDVKAIDDKGSTPLHQVYGNPVIVDLLVRAGADPNAQDNEGRTPLMSEWLELDVARALVAAGCNPEIRDRKGRTAIDLSKNTAVTEYLKSLGLKRKAVNLLEVDEQEFVLADPAVFLEDAENGTDLTVRYQNNREGRYNKGDLPFFRLLLNLNYNALVYDAQATKLAELFIEQGGEIDTRDSSGRTMMMICPVPGLTGMLLDRGADPWLTDNSGRCALFYAVGQCYETTRDYTGPPDFNQKTTMLLLQGMKNRRPGFVPDQVTDKEGQTPIFWCNDVQAVLLAASGFSVNIQDHEGMTPLMRSLGNFRTLIKLGADAGAVDNEGNTALHYLMRGLRNGQYTSVDRELLDALQKGGCDPYARNKTGVSALDLLDEIKNPENQVEVEQIRRLLSGK